MKKTLGIILGFLAIVLATASALAQTASIAASVNGACMQAAVATRDNAFIGAYNTYNVSVTTALAARRDAQVAAWALANMQQQKRALHDADVAFSAAYNQASLKLLRTKQSISLQFQRAGIACGKEDIVRSSPSFSLSSCPIEEHPAPPRGCTYECAMTATIGSCAHCTLVCPNTPPACSKGECGPAMGMPNRLCSDGSVGGPSCDRLSDGRCGWVIHQCPKS
ncbi:hypothetical protein HY213_04820 [Candidatus Peregrinibacteria bacterium]|nr:hypothetical protein [Candidatus Peregrinibacteria bacterium]